MSQLPAAIANMIDDPVIMRKVSDEYQQCSDAAKQNIQSVLDATFAKFEAPQYAPLDILKKASGDKKESMLEASAFISQHSEMRRSLHYWLINSLMETRSFGPALQAINSADPEVQKMVVSITKAMELLDEEDSETDGHVEVFCFSMDGTYGIRDDRLTDALFQYPEHAPAIAQLYIERGNVDAVDSFVATYPALREGAL